MKKNISSMHYELQRRKTRELNRVDAISNLLEESASSIDALQLIMRFQQFTVPIMAKGLEDTAFYLYPRLLSLNEVGGFPEEFGTSIEGFNKFLITRQKSWPYSFNATSTHDTKRGEDNRARINVLSEIPTQFDTQIKKWTTLNLEKKNTINNKPVPNSKEEYYLYQTLIGSFPFEHTEISEFKQRITLHMTKAIREMKKNSTWASPNLQYEEYVSSFVAQILDLKKPNKFLQEFIQF